MIRKAAMFVGLMMLAPPVQAQAPATEVVPPVATAIAAKLFPDGIYRKMLGETFSKMISGMMDRMTELPMADFMKAAGIEQEQAAKLDKASMAEIMSITDPAYKDRMRLTMDAMFKGMIPLFEQMEPELREGLAESLAHKFSVAQLGELKAFFDTPTGSSYASQQMMLFMDPAVMGRMQAQMPKIMQAMPSLIGDAVKATAGLPKPKKYSDLSPAERDKLAKLLGIDPAKMKK